MNHRILIVTALIACLLFLPLTLGALQEWQFARLATGGFGDSANSYTWGLTGFNGDVYASTVRHHLWSVAQALEGLLPIGIPFGSIVEGPPDPTWGTPAYAEAMKGEIWRLRAGAWTRVYQSDTYQLTTPIPVPQFGFVVPPGTYPKAYGYRTLGTFDGRIYALGVGTWMPPLPFSNIVRSDTGDLGDWEDVTGPVLANTTNVRGFVEWQNKVFVSASVPGEPESGLAGGCLVFGSDDGEAWTVRSEIGFGNPDNVEIYYLAVFDDHLYASTVNYVTGFEVWKTDGTMEGDKFVWSQVVKDGYGDTWNQYGMTMQPFGNYLYVGSAVGIGMVLKDGQPAGTRAIDIIRIDKDDNAELVVGAYFPVDPPDGWPTFRMPLSYMPAGFGNPFNVYSWHMAVHNGWLVVGTLDLSGTLLRTLKDLVFSDPEAAMQMLQSVVGDSNLSIPPSLLEMLNSFDLENGQQAAQASFILDYIIYMYGGADLWKTRDGIHWAPVTLSGFHNPLNYGIRRTVSIPDGFGGNRLYIGTANPFTGVTYGGCEVLATFPNFYWYWF